MSKVSDKIMRDDFRTYLITKCGLKKTSAATYIGALNRVSDLLKHNDIIAGSIYDIRNLHELQLVKETVKTLSDYANLNAEKHKNCDLSFNHYYDFAACNWKFSHKWDIRIYR